MTKKEFIWLVIRFLGIFKLILSLRVILNALPSFVPLLTLLPPLGASEQVVFFGLLGILLDAVVDILIVIYLLFFGKTIFKIVHRTSNQTLEAVLEKQDYIEILIRFIGFWWLWKIVLRIYHLISGCLLIFVFSHPERFLLANYIDQEMSDKFMTKVVELTRQNIAWYTPAYILLYAALAWYFLKHGRLFINVLNRLWLGKNTENLNQNPVDPV